MTEAVGAYGRTEEWTARVVVEDAPERFDPPAPETPERPTAFAALMGRAFGDIDRGEALVQGALRGDLGGMDAGTLIAVQAGIYRYTEAIDLVAKVVDRTGQSVRTVLTSGAQ
ncbi:MAG TPA: hypothetical protein VIL20_03505 [Sandaracinaceae bacterium]